MDTFFIIIMTNLLVTLQATKTTIHAPTAKKEDASILSAIEPNQILPLVLMQTKDSKELFPVKGMETLVAKNGRIIKGTKFYRYYDETQLFFCPSKASNENCLEPKKFNRSAILQCSTESIPVIESLDKICGPEGIGKLYKFAFKLCKPKRNYNYTTTEVVIYSICYDDQTQKTIYTEHKLSSLYALNQPLMIREKEVKFDTITDNYGRDNFNYDTYMKTLYEDKQGSSSDPKIFPYTLKQLVPPEDMAFALWRKLSFHYSNAQLQHEKLVPLWDEINDLIRKSIYQFPGEHNHMYAGVFDTSSYQEDKTSGILQVSNVWIKAVILRATMTEYHGVAITMNNFIDMKAGQSTSSDSRSEPVNEYCNESICDSKITQKFAQIGAQICCRDIDDTIKKLFSIEEYVNRVLRVKDLISLQ